MYRGSQALRLDDAAYEYEYGWEPSFTPVEGGKAQGQERRAATFAFPNIGAFLVALAIVLFVAGGISVAITSGTVGRLNSNKQTKEQIHELVSSNEELIVERSMLSQADRVSQIAEENLGMVYASDAQELELT